ncbi:trypsin-like peptidase domain-containing protein [Actinomycetes bacterium KLBMP 9797]
MTETMAPQFPTTNPSKWRRRLLAGAAVTALAVTSGVGGGLLVTELAPASTVTTTGATTAQNVSTGTTTSLAQVAAKVSPSVVTIKVSTQQGEVEGSGVVLSADGLILTNNHVVESGGTMTVTLSDGRTVDATLVGRDAGADIAVIRAAGVADLTPAAIGTSANLEVGQTVLAVGSPLGLADTVTAGIVSALNRSMDAENGESLSGLIQTDAAINPGNSGGAIVNTAGQVVGIAVAIATTGQDGGNIGVGFAIPIDTAISVANQLAS